MSKKLYNVAIVGASGAVGEELLDVLKAYDFPINNLVLFASKNSAGESRVFKQSFVIES